MLKRVAIVALLLPGVPADAGADWFVAAYVGGARTEPNTISIRQSTERIRLRPVVYEGQSWRSPIYYGGRLAYLHPRHPWLGVEFELTHLKAIADSTRIVHVDGTRMPATDVRLSTILPRFELSHGLNLAVINVAFRKPFGARDRRLVAVARIGAGTSLPHVEATLADDQRDEYQMTGISWQAGAGVEYRLWRSVYATGDLRFTAAHLNLDVASSRLSGAFRSTHLNGGVGWRFNAR